MLVAAATRAGLLASCGRQETSVGSPTAPAPTSLSPGPPPVYVVLFTHIEDNHAGRHPRYSGEPDGLSQPAIRLLELGALARSHDGPEHPRHRAARLDARAEPAGGDDGRGLRGDGADDVPVGSDPDREHAAPIQLVTYFIPLRYYAEIIRGVFLRGSGIDVLWPEALVLFGMRVAILTVASLRFRKRLD